MINIRNNMLTLLTPSNPLYFHAFRHFIGGIKIDFGYPQMTIVLDYLLEPVGTNLEFTKKQSMMNKEILTLFYT